MTTKANQQAAEQLIKDTVTALDNAVRTLDYFADRQGRSITLTDRNVALARANACRKQADLLRKSTEENGEE